MEGAVSNSTNGTMSIDNNSASNSSINGAAASNDTIRIVVIGKELVGTNPFFEYVRAGCEDWARRLSERDTRGGSSASTTVPMTILIPSNRLYW